MFSVLIVEDNISDREGIKGLIDWGKLGIEVAGLAVDGFDGYNQAINLRPDFILTDVAMPVMDGIEMTRKLKAELPQTKFIFMSRFDDLEFLKNAIHLEVYGYILKPIDLSELTDAIEKIRNLRQSELEREQYEEKLKKQIKESMPVLQEKFFKDLLYGKLENENDVRDRMEYLGMDITYKYYAVLFLQIDNYDLLYPDITMAKRYLIMYSAQKCIEETILKEITGYAANQQYNSFPIILLPNIKNHEEALNKIIDSANKCKELIGNELGLNITIGISEFSTCFTMLPQTFETAEFAAKSKFFSRGNRIIMASEVKVPDKDFQRVFFSKAESGRYQKIVDDIKLIINERYAVIDNVGQIVNPLFISASHANLIFKQQTGQTIFDYLIKRRMEIAKQMLMDPYRKIYEIVEKTGYKANSHFTSVFKEYTGLTPKQFRDKHFQRKIS